MKVQIKPVRTKGELNSFIKLPFKLYRNDPNWVPPLISERKRYLDKSKNPFFQHAEAQYYLAESNGEVVGRIAACVDYRYEEFQGRPDGSFGFFDSENDPHIAKALLDEAATWLRERGRGRMLGPMDFTANDDPCGLLIEGNDRPPSLMMPYHPCYYKQLLEGQGLVKSIDMLAEELTMQSFNFIAPIEKLAKKAEDKYGVTIREFDKSNLDSELVLFTDLLNTSFDDLWGFVPLTREEIRFRAKTLKPVLDPKFALFAERNGEILGAVLCLPDINPVMCRMNGRLWPLGWLKFLFGKRKVKGMRMALAGVKKEHQLAGIAEALYAKIRDNALSMGINHGEMAWALETNLPMIKFMKALNGNINKRYRIYERML